MMPLPRLFRSLAKNPAMNKALKQSQSNHAALLAALNNAITTSIACQLANTAQSYAKGQRLWNEFCMECQFNDGILILEDKLALWLQDVVLQLCYSPSKKWRDPSSRRSAGGSCMAAQQMQL